MVDKRFDLIVGDSDLNEFPNQWNDPDEDFQIDDSEYWLYLYNALLLLDTSGYALWFLLDEAFHLGWKRFLARLSDQGIYLTAMIGFDNDVFADLIEVDKANTGLASIIAVFSKVKRENIFIAEIEKVGNIPIVIGNFIDSRDGNNLVEGLFVDRESFTNINTYKINKQINRLQTQYSKFKTYPLGVLLDKINLGMGLESVRASGENSIFFVGNDACVNISSIIGEIDEDTNVVEIELKENIVINKYLELFFASEIGKKILDNTKIDDYYFTNKFAVIENINVPIPPLAIQQKMVETYSKLSKLTENISASKRELSLNPENAELIQAELNKFWEKVKLLTEADRILSLIHEGETKRIEFKSELYKWSKEPQEFHESILKTIVSFLNSEGGELLVGVNDKGRIIGLREDVISNIDRHKLRLKDKIKYRIGEEFYPDIDYRIVNVKEKSILLFECQPAEKPCFLDDKFYIRGNAATELIKGKKVLEYINRRFTNQSR
jgi:hypothetical protein